MNDSVDLLLGRLRKMREFRFLAKHNDEIFAVKRFLYTSAILTGLSDSGYEDRYCYYTATEAIFWLGYWFESGEKEPRGWHRHPTTGRRRPGGDPAKEYVNP